MKKLKIVFAFLCMFCLTGCGEKEILGEKQTYENVNYQETNSNLDGQYAAFGRVTHGMDVVDEIGSVVTDASDKPIKDIKIVSMEFIRIGE